MYRDNISMHCKNNRFKIVCIFENTHVMDLNASKTQLFYTLVHIICICVFQRSGPQEWMADFFACKYKLLLVNINNVMVIKLLTLSYWLIIYTLNFI